MIKIDYTIPATEYYDEVIEEFVTFDSRSIHVSLEHSLVAISKWEAKYHKPFLSNDESDDKVNDSITSNNTISIMADAYAYDHFYDMRYVEWQGAKWKVTNVEVQHPRLILTIGGLYNEHGTSSDASQSSD